MRKRTANVSWVSTVLVTSLVIVGCASIARADDEKIVARVPFAFVVGTSTMPAGKYVVAEVSDNPSVVTIASADGRQFAYTMTIPSQGHETPAKPELVFEKVENQYVLARVVPENGIERAIVGAHPHTEREHAPTALNP